MWGYSLEDLARRAQEEAARLAEQAVEQASTFNLDALNNDAEEPPPTANSSSDNGFFTPTAPAAAPAVEARQIQTEPAKTASVQQNEGNADHFSALVSKSPSSPDRKKVPVTKLSMNTDDGDDFFDGWGEDDIDLGNDDAGNKQQQPAADESDAAAEQMREESRLMAEKIVKEEEERKKKEEEERLERERLEAERVEAERLEQERLDQERIAAEKAEAERLEKERRAAEEAAKREAEEKVRVEAERLEQERLELERLEQERLEQERVEAERLEAEQLEQERLAAEEAARLEAEETARLEAERLVQERLAAEETARLEAERLEHERLAAEEAERLEQERLAAAEAERLEAERLEQERLAAEEADRLEQDRLAAEEAARLEAERLEQERLAAEEAARLEAERLDEERLEAERLEAERVEQERLSAEAEAARLEAERLEQERLEAERLEQERLDAAEAERLEKERIEAERLEQERLEQERIDRERILEEQRQREEEKARLEERLAAVEAARAEQERLSAETVESTDQGQVGLPETKPDEEDELDEGDAWDDDGLDDMYDDDDDSDDQSAQDEPKSAPESIPDDRVTEHVQSTPDNAIPETDKVADADEENTAEGQQPAAASEAEASFFDAAAALTQTSTSLQSMFDTTAVFEEASKTASMFSWGYGENEEAPATEDSTIAPEQNMEPITEDDAVNEVEDTKPGSHDEQSAEASGQDKGDGNEATASEAMNQVADESSSGQAANEQQGVPQHTLDNFIKQLERMTESHQLEMDEMQRMHKMETDRLQIELEEERESKKKVKARDEVASQDKFLKQMRELEKKFTGTIKEKEDELEDVMKRNEGMGLKMETLKREVEGLTKLVDERDEEIMKLKQGYGNSMLQVEGQVKTSQEELTRRDDEISELKNSVTSLQTDLDTTSEAYNSLKARAKAVATELKDRRVEVRNLTAHNEELSSTNETFETQLTNLRAIVNQHEITISYKDKDMEALNDKVKELNKQIEQGSVKSAQDRSVGEKAIASYKRKAQEALAAANARLAAANQAREEAEIDAKNARSASDDAVERARVAEAKKAEAEQKAIDLNSLIESERTSSSKEVNELKEAVGSLRETVNSLQSEAEEAANTRVKLVAELEQLNSDLMEQKEKASELREQLIESNTLCESLQREVNDLTDEVQRSSAAAFKRAKDSGGGSSAENHVNRSNSNLMTLDCDATSGDRQESDGTIIMLQQELHGANEAIAELKLALRTALLEKADSEYSRNKDAASMGSGAPLPHESDGGGASESRNGNESTPLFFAIEKQNELKTARDEINRLANMLGDAESAKQEAYDAMDEMRQKMEEADARLLRYEKLGMKSTGSRPPASHSSYGPFRTNAAGHSGVLHDDTSRSAHSGNDSVVNLEYLKNIMLSFLTATTLADRRKLVPVVATVLCLTPEEQAQAINSVEQSAGLTGVASSFWENVSSKAHNF